MRFRKVAQSSLRVLLVLGLSGLSPAGLAATITVDVDGGADFSDIQAAVDAAQDGDTVLVKAGEYVIAQPIDFNRLYLHLDPASPPLKNIVLRSEAGPEATVIRRAPPVECGCRYGVVIFEKGETEASVLSGFTLKGYGGLTGAGVNLGSWPVGRPPSPVIENCIITENYAIDSSAGGGLMSYGGAPTLIDCTIAGNISGYDNDTAGGVSFHGGSGTLVGCRIVGNSLRAGSGGGVAIDGGASVSLIDCVIMGNYSSWGGGVVCMSSSDVLLVNCLVAGNAAESDAGIGCVDSSLDLVNCTVADNHASSDGSCAGVRVAYSSAGVKNGIFWGNDASSLVVDENSSAAVTFSTIESDTLFPGEGNSGADPLFLKAGAFDFERFATFQIEGVEFRLPDFIVDPPDYHLKPESPALDAGTSSGAPTTDLEGHGRPCGAGVDMGAYEAGACPATTRQFRRADVNSDGALDIADPISLLGYLFLGGAAPQCIDAADADDSGALDITDAVHSLGFQFLGTAAPASPFPGCGVDPSVDDLGCEAYPGCE